jgi:hypothetical protein
MPEMSLLSLVPHHPLLPPEERCSSAGNARDLRRQKNQCVYHRYRQALDIVPIKDSAKPSYHHTRGFLKKIGISRLLQRTGIENGTTSNGLGLYVYLSVGLSLRK